MKQNNSTELLGEWKWSPDPPPHTPNPHFPGFSLIFFQTFCWHPCTQTTDRSHRLSRPHRAPQGDRLSVERFPRVQGLDAPPRPLNPWWTWGEGIQFKFACRFRGGGNFSLIRDTFRYLERSLIHLLNACGHPPPTSAPPARAPSVPQAPSSVPPAPSYQLSSPGSRIPNLSSSSEI